MIRRMVAVPPLRLLLVAAPLLTSVSVNSAYGSPIVISGWLTNVQGDDSPYEYTQLVATEPIDFSLTPYTIVWNDVGLVGSSGTASFSDGWAGGSLLSYAFQLTSGTVARGETFYIGGSAQLLTGSGSASLAGQKWLRSINTSVSGGDGLGIADPTGVLGNGGPHKDGIAVFAGLAGAITTTTVPLDTVFFGDPSSSIGNAYPGPNNGGFKAADNDHYTSTGVFGDPGNTFFFPDLNQNQFMHLSGTYNYVTDTWEVARTATVLNLTTASPVSTIAAEITLVPEPGAGVLAVGAAVALFSSRRRRRL
jgi:hypothetical protein